MIKYLVSQNIVASIGHTNATYADVKKATKAPEYRDKLMKEYKLVG